MTGTLKKNKIVVIKKITHRTLTKSYLTKYRMEIIYQFGINPLAMIPRRN